ARPPCRRRRRRRTSRRPPRSRRGRERRRSCGAACGRLPCTCAGSVTMMIVIVKRSDSRERMLGSAVQLLREQGYTGTGFRDVIAHSGAPRGSIYHHFPGGKVQLAEEAVVAARDYVTSFIDAAKGEDDPVA